MRHHDPFEHVIDELQRVGSISDLPSALEVGRLVLGVYGGDVALSSRRGPKRRSVEAIALRSGCPFSVTTLRRCLAIFRITMRAPELEKLTLRHAYLVLGLPAEKQRELVTRAVAESWSTAHLAIQVALRRQ